ncbi:MAG: thioredoxin family protein [Bacteroidia bacterium]
MKKLTSSLLVIATVMVTAFKPDTTTELAIGAKIPKPDYKMLDVSGKEISLNDAKGENGLLVIFSCNTCPYVKLSETRIKEVAAFAKRNKVGMILVNSNEAQREAEDSFEEMKKYAQAQKYDFYYTVDKNSQLADAFGATRTPHVFLFDKNALAYKGAIDDNIRDAASVKDAFLKDAIVAIGSGKAVKTTSSKSVGCSIKRVE